MLSYSTLADVIVGPGTSPPRVFLVLAFSLARPCLFHKKEPWLEKANILKGDLYNGCMCLKADIQHQESNYPNGSDHHGDLGSPYRTVLAAVCEDLARWRWSSLISAGTHRSC